MTWTSEIVIYRLIRAADTIRRLPGRGLKPAGFTSAWPALRDEWADHLARVGSEETRGRDRPRLSPPRPGEIDRMYQCMDWMVHVSDPGHRKALMIYCRDKAYGWRFSRTCKKLGWNRRTAYNRKDKAAHEVAVALNNKAVSLPQIDIDVVAQIPTTCVHQRYSEELCMMSWPAFPAMPDKADRRGGNSINPVASHGVFVTQYSS